MKNAVLAAILIIFLLGGCSNVMSGNKKNDGNTMKDVHIAEIERYDVKWDQIQFPIDLQEIEVLDEIGAIETNQAAVEIATTIIEKFHEKGKVPDYTLISIIHSTEDNVWRFEYSMDQRNKDVDDLVDCGCLYVAIDGNEGKLIKAWVEE